MKNHDEAQLLTGLKTIWLGHNIHFYKELVSTNLTARKLAETNTPNGT